MLRTRRSGLALATLAAALLLGVSNQADAAFRVTLSGSPTGDLVFFTNTTGSPITIATPVFTYDGYTGNLLNSISNFPGGTTAGTLSTTFNVTSTSGAVPISINTAIVDNVAGLATGVVFSSTAITGATTLTAAQLTSVNTAALSNFTSPTGPTLIISADAGRSVNTTVTGGVMQTTTTSNGLNVLTGFVPIIGNDPAFTSATFPNPNASGVFNLQQTLNISGINNGAAGYALTASSAVTAVPEPSSLALGMIGVFTVAGVALRRKLSQRQIA